jgi:type II secretion system protein N
MSETARRLVKWIGYPLYGLFCFLFFVYLALPYDRLKTRIEEQVARSGDMELTIGELGPRPLLGVVMDRVVVLMKPKARPLDGSSDSTKSKPLRVFLDTVVVKSGLWALLTGGVDLYVAVSGLGGEIQGTYESDPKKGWTVKGEISRLNLGRLPFLSDAVGLPLGGSLSAKVDLSVPQDRWSNAVGLLDIECDGCSVGDGKALLKVPGNPLLAMGITLPKLRLGRLGGQVKLEKGTATLESFTATSPDVEVAMEGTVSLNNAVAFSTAQLYLRFKISPELKKRDAKFELVENGLTNAKRADGFYGMLVTGPLRSLRFNPSPIGPARDRATPGGPGIPRPGRRFPVQGQAPSARPAPHQPS